jgi:hypothetical protein
MAHFDAPDTGRRYYPFGEGGLERVREVMARFGVPESRLFTLPIDAALSAAGDAGVPEVVARPGSAVSAVYAPAVSADVHHSDDGDARYRLHPMPVYPAPVYLHAGKTDIS